MKKAQTTYPTKQWQLLGACILLNAIGILAYRAGVELLFWPVAINTLFIIYLAVRLMPKALAVVFGSLGLLALIGWSFLFITVYLLSVTPMLGDALRADPPELWAVVIAIVCVLAIVIACVPLYLYLEKTLARKFKLN